MSERQTLVSGSEEEEEEDKWWETTVDVKASMGFFKISFQESMENAGFGNKTSTL